MRAYVAGALIRLGLDQLLWAPVFISTFLASLLTLEVCLCCLRCSIEQAVPTLLMSSSCAVGPVHCAWHRPALGFISLYIYIMYKP